MAAAAKTAISLYTLSKFYLFMNNRSILAASLAGLSASCINKFSLMLSRDLPAVSPF